MAMWRQAADEEMLSLQGLGVHELVEKLEDAKLLKS
jgi:hypothetical protein